MFLFLVPSISKTQEELLIHNRLAKTKNGTYVGIYNDRFHQDFFLGMRYAQSPVRDLRFRLPLSTNVSWKDSQPAFEYGPHCIGYGVSHNLTQS